MQDSYFTQVRVCFLETGSFTGFGGLRTSQSLHIYLPLRPNWTNANKHVFQIYLCHSGAAFGNVQGTKGNCLVTQRSHPGCLSGLQGDVPPPRQGCTGPRRAPSQALGLSAVCTAPRRSPVPREGILRKK